MKFKKLFLIVGTLCGASLVLLTFVDLSKWIGPQTMDTKKFSAQDDLVYKIQDKEMLKKNSNKLTIHEEKHEHMADTPSKTIVLFDESSNGTNPASMETSDATLKKNGGEPLESELTNESPQRKQRTDTNRFAVQVASFKAVHDAENHVDYLLTLGYKAYYQRAEIPQKGTWFRVRIGNFESIAGAKALRKELTGKNIKSIVVQESLFYEDK